MRRAIAVSEVLNPDGYLIKVPAWVVRRLDKMKMLYWDRKLKHWQMLPVVMTLLKMEQVVPGFVHHQLRALNPEFASGWKPGGRCSPLLRALGADCSGLNVDISHTRRLEEDYRNVPLPGAYVDEEKPVAVGSRR